MRKLTLILMTALLAMLVLPATSTWAHCGSCGVEAEGDHKDHNHGKEAKAESAEDTDSTKASEKPEIVTLESGVRYMDIKGGEGVAAEMKMECTVHYTVWLDDGEGNKGKRLQSSKDRNQPFTCTVGYQLIEGWSQGMVGMKEGGTRQLWVPWKLGYGAGGRGNMIPGKADLIFEIEFLKKGKL